MKGFIGRVVLPLTHNMPEIPRPTPLVSYSEEFLWDHDDMQMYHILLVIEDMDCFDKPV
jgi:hypothetical protein